MTPIWNHFRRYIIAWFFPETQTKRILVRKVEKKVLRHRSGVAIAVQKAKRVFIQAAIVSYGDGHFQ